LICVTACPELSGKKTDFLEKHELNTPAYINRRSANTIIINIYQAIINKIKKSHAHCSKSSGCSSKSSGRFAKSSGRFAKPSGHFAKPFGRFFKDV